MEGVRFDIGWPRCRGCNQVAEEIGHRVDAGGSLPESDLRPDESISWLCRRCSDEKPDAPRDLRQGVLPQLLRVQKDAGQVRHCEGIGQAK